jgi:hypothetical protein
MSEAARQSAVRPLTRRTIFELAPTDAYDF